MKTKIIICIVLFTTISCGVLTQHFQTIEGSGKVDLHLVSFLDYKEFVLSLNDNTEEETYIMSKRITKMNEFQPMKYDKDRKAFVFGLKISDYTFYRKIEKDTIIIKQNDKIMMFRFVK